MNGTVIPANETGMRPGPLMQARCDGAQAALARVRKSSVPVGLTGGETIETARRLWNRWLSRVE